ncbi:protein shisa-9-like [Arapaima gigas]
MVDYSHHQATPLTFQPIALHPKEKSFMPPPDIHAPLAITISASQQPKPKISKTNTHPLTSSSAFKAWDPSKSYTQHPVSHLGQPTSSRRQAYSGKRQFSIETLPELFSQPLGYGHSSHQMQHPQKLKGLPTNSKTEATMSAYNTHHRCSDDIGPDGLILEPRGTWLKWKLIE